MKNWQKEGTGHRSGNLDSLSLCIYTQANTQLHSNVHHAVSPRFRISGRS